MFDSEILSLYTPWDLQEALRDFLLERRKVLKKSRRSLAEQSGIPAPTIRRFEETGEISFRQFCVLWCTLSDENAFMPLSPEAQAKVEELRAAGVIIPQLPYREE